MNVPQNSTVQHSALNSTLARRPSIKWLVPLVVVPIVGFAVYVGWLLASEYQAYRAMNAAMSPISASGPSPADAWLAKNFAETTSSEGTAAWSEIIMLSKSVGWNAINDLPIVGNGQTLRTLEVGAQWEDQKLVDDYLKEAQPLLELIYEAEKYPTPVWQPMDFRGINTLLPNLQDSRQIARILQLDFEQAIVGNDPPRAMRDLQAMQNTADAFDWDMFMVGEMVNVALRGMRYGAIQRSLHADVWTKQDLERLIEQTQKPLPLAQSWQRSIESEKALGMGYVDGPMFSPSSRLLMLERYAQIQAVGTRPPGEYATRASELEQQWQESIKGGDIIAGLLLPAIVGYATTFDRLERSRRLVLTSLAVKLFHLTHERWPKDLQELKQVGLKSEDWTLPGIGPLGYAIQDNGQSACVWGVPSVNSGLETISDKCPDHAGEELEKASYYLTLIR